MTFRIAVVQPICHRPGTDENNVAEAESTAAGIAEVDVDLARLRYLRTTRDEVGSPGGCAAKQGVLGPQWQRPELYDLIHPRPLREAAE